MMTGMASICNVPDIQSTRYCDMRGQLLDYGRVYVDSIKKEVRLVLLTTYYDLSTAQTIKHYNLPIRYVYMDKERMLEAESV